MSYDRNGVAVAARQSQALKFAQAFADEGCRLVTVDLRVHPEKGDFALALQAGFDAPEPGGVDWAISSLSEPDWLPPSGFVVLLDGWDAAAPQVREVAPIVACNVVDRGRGTLPELPYWFVFVADADRADLLARLQVQNDRLDEHGRRLPFTNTFAVPVVELD